MYYSVAMYQIWRVANYVLTDPINFERLLNVTRVC